MDFSQNETQTYLLCLEEMGSTVLFLNGATHMDQFSLNLINSLSWGAFKGSSQGQYNSDAMQLDTRPESVENKLA